MGAYKIAVLAVLSVAGGLLVLAQLQNMGLVERPEAESTTIDAESTAMLIHELINEERQQAGLRELAWNDRLASVALAHSQNMIDNAYLDHVSSDGKTLRQRYAEGGIGCAIGAENLTEGGSYYGQNSEQEIGSESVQGWMNSEGHRANILNPSLSREGIGIAFNESGTIAKITQNFC